ncbi:MAG: cystathionine beta-synthase, partial [Cryomorphaceae bacterium]
MEDTNVLYQLKDVLNHMPDDWLRLTTHRLDIYNEERAKTDFLEGFEKSLTARNSALALQELPTAYDYIRLGHPLSSILEWAIAQWNHSDSESVISFSSETMPVLAVLRNNLFARKNTRIIHDGGLPRSFDSVLLKRVYGYSFEVEQVDSPETVSDFDGSTVFVSRKAKVAKIDLNSSIDFYVQIYPELGSILIVNGDKNQPAISEIQHVRRRETIAMTPDDCLTALELMERMQPHESAKGDVEKNLASVLNSIQNITGSPTTPLIGSSGLSIQYAIMMGLIDDALENHPGKPIRFIVPPNCYGGTNDQARRVAACLEN